MKRLDASSCCDRERRQVTGLRCQVTKLAVMLVVSASVPT